MKIRAIFLFVFAISNTNAQTFPNKFSSVLEMLNDTAWIKENAKKIRGIKSNNPDGVVTLYKPLVNCVLFSENENGKKIIEKKINNNPKKIDKSIIPYFYCYFLQELNPIRNIYYQNLKSFFEKYPATYQEKQLISQYNLISDFNPSDTAVFNNSLAAFNINVSGKKEFTAIDIENIAMASALIKLSTHSTQDQLKFKNEISKEVEVEEEQYAKLWNDREYDFLPKDKPKPIIAANMQMFDVAIFKNQVWANDKEIPNNGKDDDHNGIVDDVNGFIYNQNTHKNVGINSNTISFNQFLLPDNNYKEDLQLPHGNMAVELMQIGNPYVKTMLLHVASDWWAWKDNKRKFTNDSIQNRKIMYAFVDRLVKSFKDVGRYCKENNVRVVQNNFCIFGGDDADTTDIDFGEKDKQAELKRIHNEMALGIASMEQLAPNTLFIFAAGNEGTNLDEKNILQQYIRLNNNLIVGALHKDLRKTNYSNYGKLVEIYAPAHFKLTAKNTYPESSGTSAAAPVACNLAIKLFSLNPNLTPKEVKEIIINSSDKDLYENGINVINPKKAVALMKRKNKN